MRIGFRALAGALAALALAAAGTPQAGQLAAEVAVKVRLVTSSGACGVVDSAAEIGVSCRPGGGGALLPAPGEVSYQRMGTVPALGVVGVVTEPLPLYSDGVKITSWRIVKLDNAEYLELTVAW